MVFSYVLILYTQTIRENFEFASIKILQILVKIKFSWIIVNLKSKGYVNTASADQNSWHQKYTPPPAAQLPRAAKAII